MCLDHTINFISAEFYTCWGNAFFSCLVNNVTSSISHWWVFSHTLQSTDRQFPGGFVLGLHILCYESIISLGFLWRSESNYKSSAAHYFIIPTPDILQYHIYVIFDTYIYVMQTSSFYYFSTSVLNYTLLLLRVVLKTSCYPQIWEESSGQIPLEGGETLLSEVMQPCLFRMIHEMKTAFSKETGDIFTIRQHRKSGKKSQSDVIFMGFCSRNTSQHMCRGWLEKNLTVDGQKLQFSPRPCLSEEGFTKYLKYFIKQTCLKITEEI